MMLILLSSFTVIIILSAAIGIVVLQVRRSSPKDAQACVSPSAASSSSCSSSSASTPRSPRSCVRSTRARSSSDSSSNECGSPGRHVHFRDNPIKEVRESDSEESSSDEAEEDDELQICTESGKPTLFVDEILNHERIHPHRQNGLCIIAARYGETKNKCSGRIAELIRRELQAAGSPTDPDEIEEIKGKLIKQHLRQLDVTQTVRSMVSESQDGNSLVIPAGVPKHALPGFRDPCAEDEDIASRASGAYCLTERRFLIIYRYNGDLDVLECGDCDEVRLPKPRGRSSLCSASAASKTRSSSPQRKSSPLKRSDANRTSVSSAPQQVSSSGLGSKCAAAVLLPRVSSVDEICVTSNS